MQTSRFPSMPSSDGPLLTAEEVALARADAQRAWKILDACPDSVITLHENGRILNLNTAAQKAFGYGPTKIRPTLFRELILFPPDWPHSLQAMVGVRWEVKAQRADGEEFPCELTVTRPDLEHAPVFTAYLRDITDQKKTDRDLRESELRFRALFEQSPMSMQRFATNGISLRVNRAFENLFQLSNERLVAAKFNLLNDAQVRASGVMPLLLRAFAGEPTLVPPTAFRPKDSVPGGRADTRYIRAYFFPIRDESDNIREIVAMHEDATDLIAAEAALKELNQDLETKIAERTKALEEEIRERLVTEAALRESEQRFRAIVETQVELVSRYTPEGVITYVNPAHERLYGLTAGEYIGQNWIEALPAELRETIRKKISLLTPDESVFQLLHPKIIPKTGRAAHEHWVNRGLFDESGQLQEIQAVGRDVTELIETERRLKESEAKFRRLFEETRAGVILIDGATLLEVNPAAQKMFGLASAEEAVGHTVLEFSAEYQTDGIPSRQAMAQITKLRSEDGSIRYEWLCRTKSGIEFPIEAFTSSVVMGGRVLALGILQDISERKRSENELRNALQHERELSQLKSNFVSMVSHEYRNPLGIILSSTELLKRYYDRLDQADRMESLIDIEVATRRMAAMIDNLLLMGKLDAGKLEMNAKPIDLVAFCQGLIGEVLSSTGAGREIRFEHQGIDSAAVTDEQLLRIILSNLITNALKYSPPNHAPSLSLSRLGRHGVISIHDDGIGIPAEDRPILFQTFGRARNVGVVNGTGLGLYIVKHCVDLHEGTIELESAVGKGTTVIITLPIFPNAKEAMVLIDEAKKKTT